MAEHEQGSMDITVQEKTFDGFMKIVSRSTIGIIIFIVFLGLIAA